MDVCWIGENGSVQGATWNEGSDWDHFQLAPPGNASTTGSITAMSRIEGTLEVWWIGANGSVEHAYWTERLQ